MRDYTWPVIITLAAFLLLWATFCFADTFRITGDSYTWDTYVSYNAQTTNFGNATTMSVRDAYGSMVRISLLKFDLSGLSGTVTAAYCSLYVDAGDCGEVYIVSSRMITDWNEMEATWDTAKTSPELDWVSGEISASDFTQNSDTITVNATDDWFVWDVTPIVATQVSTSTNYGIALWATPPSTDDCNQLLHTENQGAHYPILYGEYTTGGATRFTFQQGVDGYAGCEEVGMYRLSPSTNYGSAIYIEIGDYLTATQRMTSLIRFNNLGLSDFTCISCTLALYIYNAPGDYESDTLIFDFHEALRWWVENEATYGVWAIGQDWTDSGGTNNGTDAAIAMVGTGCCDYDESCCIDDDTNYFEIDTSLVNDWLVAEGDSNKGLFIQARYERDYPFISIRSSEMSGNNLDPMLILWVQTPTGGAGGVKVGKVTLRKVELP